MINEIVPIRQKHRVFEIQGVVYIHSTSQFGSTTFQVLNSPMRSVATVLDHEGLEGFFKQMGVDKFDNIGLARPGEFGTLLGRT